MLEPPRTGDAVLDLIRKSELVGDDVLSSYVDQNALPAAASDTASMLVRSGMLTAFQARLILQGRYKGFKLGAYVILDQIGAGGMGQVFLAEHTAMRRRVALKVLPSKQAADRNNVERFYREARAVAALDHPNIVRAHDVCHDRGAYFLVLEYVDGKNLADLLRARGGRLAYGEAAGLVAQAAAGLQHAHEKGLVHRDVKPGNLLVDRDGVVKILDMGLARFFEDENDQLTKKFESGAVMGTADYVAPEQLLDSSAADCRADLYSLGATLYHLIAGQTPFTGTTTAKLVAHQLKTAPPVHEVRPEVPVGLSDVVARMMAKDPAARYQTAAEVVHDLLPFAADPAGAGPGTSRRLPPMAQAGVSRSTGNLTTAVLRAKELAAEEAGKSTASVTAQATMKVGGPAAPASGPRPVAPAPSSAVIDIEVGPEPAPRGGKRLLVFAAVGLAVAAAGGLTAFALIGKGPDKPTARVQPDDQAATPKPPPAADPVTPPAPPAGGKPPAGPPAPPALALAYKLPVADPKTATDAVLFTPDGARVVTAGQDRKVRVWDAATGNPIRVIDGHLNAVRGLALMPGGRRVLSCGLDKTVRLTDLEAGHPARVFEGHGGNVQSVAAHPDGRRFLSGAAGGEIWLWDAETGEVVRKFNHTKGTVTGLAVLADGKRAVAASFYNKRADASGEADSAAATRLLWAFDLETGAVLRETTPPAPPAHVAVSPDERTVALGTFDGVMLWDLGTGGTRALVGLTPPADGTSARVLGVAFTPDGRHVLATGWDRGLSAWAVADGRRVMTEPVLPAAGADVRVSPDGRRAAVVGAGGGAGVWVLPAGVAP